MAESRTATAIRFDPELHERLAAAAAERGVSLNWLVNRLLDEALQHLVPVESLLLIERTNGKESR